MIDTVFASTSEVVSAREMATGGRAVDLCLAPIQPMREIALATADHVGFDAKQYRHMLACAAAVGARHLVPSAAGDAHAPPFTALNAWVYPVTRERAARDLVALAPGTRTWLPAVGEALVLEGSDVGVAPGDVAVELLGDDPSRAFRPLEPAPLVDFNLPGLDVATYRVRIGDFVRDELAPKLREALSSRDDLGDIRMVLEVVYESTREAFTFDRFGGVTAGGIDEYEVLNVAAGSLLWEVIEGRRAWGEPLLAGALRASVRGVSIVDGVVRPLSIATMFPYYALSYAESVRRAALYRARRAAAS
jgi:hypothetical protein